jgi:hypothetical protein
MSVGAAGAFLLVQEVLERGASTESAFGSGRFRHPPDFSLADAEQFDAFSLYWLGPTFQDLPVRRLFKEEHVSTVDGVETPTNLVLFDYGDCTIAEGADACGAPLTIVIRPYCEVPPEIVADRVKSGPPVEIRGARAQWIGGGLILWTKDASITMAGESRELVGAAAEGLVNLTPGDTATPADALGPPNPVKCPPQPNYLP